MNRAEMTSVLCSGLMGVNLSGGSGTLGEVLRFLSPLLTGGEVLVLFGIPDFFMSPGTGPNLLWSLGTGTGLGR